MEDDIRECPVCDRYISLDSFKKHFKGCKKTTIDRWRNNSQAPTGLNLTQFVNENYCVVHRVQKQETPKREKEMPEQDFECPICFKDVQTLSSYVMRTKCDHVFCEPCLTRWLEISACCPKCRGPQ